MSYYRVLGLEVEPFSTSPDPAFFYQSKEHTSALYRLRIAIELNSTWAGCPKVHVVRRGQTLSGIARWYGRTTWALTRANSLRNPNRIYTGQRLCIPNWGYCW